MSGTRCHFSRSSGCSPRRWPTRAASLSEPWRTLYGLNPMAGVVEGFRWALLDTGSAPGPIVVVVDLRGRDSARRRRVSISGGWNEPSPTCVEQTDHGPHRDSCRRPRQAIPHRPEERAVPERARGVDHRLGVTPFSGWPDRRAATAGSRQDLGAAGRLVRGQPRRGRRASSAATAPARARS